MSPTEPASPASGRAQRDQESLSEACSLVRQYCPEAVAVLLETSDQDRYGFFLSGVEYASGEVVGHPWYGDNPWPAEVDDQICDLLSDLDWDGVVGESPQGYARINL